MSADQKPRQFITIQAARGLAAMMVVLFHCLIVWNLGFGGGDDPNVYQNGSGGVDIFFIISGFVMAVSSEGLAANKDGWKIFIIRRLIRIVPLYWILTTVKSILMLASHMPESPWNVIASYLFIPSRDVMGEIRPLISDGWTLTFEMLFYTLFSVCLKLNVKPLRLLTPAFLFLSALSFIRYDDWPAPSFIFNTLTIEFVWGVLLGELTMKGGIKLDRKLAVALAVISLILLFTLPTGPNLGNALGVGRPTLRVLTWGIPAWLFLTSLVSLEGWLGPRIPKWLKTVGDASYSIYLVHGFILAAMVKLIGKFYKIPLPLFILAGFVGAAIGGIVLYRVLEHPMQKKFSGLVKKRHIAN